VEWEGQTRVEERERSERVGDGLAAAAVDDDVLTTGLGSEMDQREGREGSAGVRVRFRGRRGGACSHNEASGCG
jgi:hypothetical protein